MADIPEGSNDSQIPDPIAFRQQCCSAEVVESCYNVLNLEAPAVVLAPQELIDFVQLNSSTVHDHNHHNHDNHVCHPATLQESLDYIKEHGISQEKNYPYVGGKKPFVINIHDRPTRNKVKIGGFVSLNNGETINSRVACHPIAAFIYLTNEFVKKNEAGIYKVTSDDSVIMCTNRLSGGPLTHAVLVVGFGKDQDSDDIYWIIKNSFGEDWGDKGFRKICRRSRFLGKPLLFNAVFPFDLVMHENV
ncbi:cysteine proteinase-like [Impatiens glandulifera]|uniref:cysteine proteinase-like n=1 Tax=Impatiens glandulifera TaxID=253017 RepID=UPI001FB0A0B7|nr:cysteine proteinase-like [Impatiens glandulifera]